MTDTRVIKKVLGGAEDLLFGQGTVEQIRNNQPVLISKINAETVPFSGDPQTGDKVSIVEKINSLETSTLLSRAVSISSVSDLLAVDGTVEPVANVLNYHSDVEGGGGVFYWDANRDCGEHNGGTIIAHNANFPPDWTAGNQQLWFAPMTGTGCWVRQYDGAVNVKWFGAKGDGVTDDTAPVQSSVNIGGNVYVPVGTYLITDTISLVDFSGKIVGEGSRRSTSISLLKLSTTESGKALFQVTSSLGHAISFENLAFDGINNVDGLEHIGFKTIADGATNTANIHFTLCYFVNWSKAGCVLSDQWNITFNNTWFHNCGVNGVTETGGVVFTPAGVLAAWSGSGNTIRDCQFTSCSYGIYANSIWGLLILASIFESNDYAYYKTAAGTTLTEIGCWHESNTNEPVNLRGGFTVYGRGRTDIDPQTGYLVSAVSDTDFSLFDLQAEKHFHVNSQGAERLAGRLGDSANTNKPLQITGGGTTANGEKTLLVLNAHAGVYPTRYGNLTDWNDHSNVAYIKYTADGGTAFARGKITIGTGSNTNDTTFDFADRWAWNYLGHYEPLADNSYNIGSAPLRVKEIFAANGTINTSDGNLKQQINNLTDAERQVAKTIKGSIKSFKFNDSVEDKGEKARTHFGVIAQDVEQAFYDSGLDPKNYALWCKDAWYTYNGEIVEVDSEENYVETHWELNGETVEPDKDNKFPKGSVLIENKYAAEKHERLGIRYEELLCFIISAI
jgi:hypothetical protein